MIRLGEFLRRARRVTDNYKVIFDTWSMKDQDKKIDEEVREFKNPSSDTNEIEEAWDVFFAVLTKLHLRGYSDDQIYEIGVKTLGKIEGRVEQKARSLGIKTQMLRFSSRMMKKCSDGKHEECEAMSCECHCHGQFVRDSD